MRSCNFTYVSVILRLVVQTVPHLPKLSFVPWLLPELEGNAQRNLVCVYAWMNEKQSSTRDGLDVSHISPAWPKHGADYVMFRNGHETGGVSAETKLESCSKFRICTCVATTAPQPITKQGRRTSLQQWCMGKSSRRPHSA